MKTSPTERREKVEFEMRAICLVLAILGLVPMDLFAQSSVIVPAQSDPNLSCVSWMYPGNGLPGLGGGRRQQVYSQASIPFPATITKIAFKSSQGVLQTCSWYITIIIGTTSYGPGALSPIFSQNMGNTGILAYQGYMLMVRNSISNCFDPFECEVQLTNPYLYQGGGNLLLDITFNQVSNFCYAFSNSSPDASSLVDLGILPNATAGLQASTICTRFQFADAIGTATNFGLGSPAADGSIPTILSFGVPAVSNCIPFTIKVSNVQITTTAILAISEGHANFPVAEFGGAMCFVSTTQLILVQEALVTVGCAYSNQGVVSGTIPNVPALVGQDLYAQWAVLDPLLPWLVPYALSPGLHIVIGP